MGNAGAYPRPLDSESCDLEAGMSQASFYKIENDQSSSVLSMADFRIFEGVSGHGCL